MTVSAFRTVDGVVVPAVTTVQMREVDRVAVDDLGPNLYQMMENAGRSLAELAIELVEGETQNAIALDSKEKGDDWTTTPIMVFAGTGGNGGGGICAARHLVNHGGDITLVLTDIGRLREVPTEQLALFRAAGGRIAELGDIGPTPAGLIVDAVLGYSLSGAPTGGAVELIRWMSAQHAPILSLDVPSGVDATTGVSPGVHVNATTTMTLALPKTGLDSDAVGELWLADIGIPRQTYERAGLNVPPGLFARGFLLPLHP